ncbi:hypothetical protein ACJZ2D_002091 [Fusarium nematophilum]
MDPGTILAIVSLGLQVIKLADSVIETFDRVQNAPQELRDFRQAVVRLQRHFELLKADSRSSATDFLDENDAHEIQDTLMLCEKLLQDHIELQKKNLVNSVIRGVWTIRNNQNLVRYKDRIEKHYIQILLPCWLNSIGRAPRDPPPPAEHELKTEQMEQMEQINNTPLVPPQQLQNISDKLKELETAGCREDVEKTLRAIDLELRKCRIQGRELGLLGEEHIDPVEDPEHPIQREIKRRDSLEFQPARTTLYLESAPKQHRKLKLESLHIMARDDESRILQYRNKNIGATIHVTHIVPYGSIPWTPDKTSKRVSFLKNHLITVVDPEGYHLYRLDPKYKFEDQEACEKFQSVLRERELSGAFEAVEIKMGKQIVARRQMIRFWHRAGDNGATINTLTFYISSVGRPGDHEELDLAGFEHTATILRPRRLSLGKTESNSVDLRPSNPNSRRLHIKFDTSEEAGKFKAKFEAMHNEIHPAPLSSGSGSTVTESTLAPTPSITSPSPSCLPRLSLDMKSQGEDLGSAFDLYKPQYES